MEAFQQSNSSDEIKRARALVFMNDIQSHLRSDNAVFQLTLEVQIIRNMYDESWYVIARNEAGEEVTGQNSNGRGQHGHFVHPGNGTGTPKMVAASLANDLRWFNKKRNEAKKEQEA